MNDYHKYKFVFQYTVMRDFSGSSTETFLI